MRRTLALIEQVIEEHKQSFKEWTSWFMMQKLFAALKKPKRSLSHLGIHLS